MKSKKIYLLLLLGAAVILTVIWTTRGVSKPSSYYTSFLTSSLNSPSSSSVPNDINIVEQNNVVNFNSSDLIKNNQCPSIQNVKPVIDTAEIYPKLNFNVSYEDKYIFFKLTNVVQFHGNFVHVEIIFKN